jgi:pimeloyl-ACP methyl ester carboxylesterase
MTSAMTQSTLTLHDYAIDTRTSGSGPTLLYLPGFGGASAVFRDGKPAAFLTEWSRSHRVLVPEHPGFGTREKPEWLDTIHDLAYFYLDYLDALDLREVHVVGSSIGGWIALEMAIRSRERMASLTLAGSAGIHVAGVPRADIFLMSREQFAAETIADTGVRAAFLGAKQSAEEELVELRNNLTTALVGWKPRFYDAHLHKWLGRLKLPTHVVWAEDDRIFPSAYGEAFARVIPGAKRTVIAGARHLMHLDRPVPFASAVAGFIKEHAS